MSTTNATRLCTPRTHREARSSNQTSPPAVGSYHICQVSTDIVQKWGEQPDNRGACTRRGWWEGGDSRGGSMTRRGWWEGGGDGHHTNRNGSFTARRSLQDTARGFYARNSTLAGQLTGRGLSRGDDDGNVSGWGLLRQAWRSNCQRPRRLTGSPCGNRSCGEGSQRPRRLTGLACASRSYGDGVQRPPRRCTSMLSANKFYDDEMPLGEHSSHIPTLHGCPRAPVVEGRMPQAAVATATVGLAHRRASASLPALKLDA